MFLADNGRLRADTGKSGADILACIEAICFADQSLNVSAPVLMSTEELAGGSVRTPTEGGHA